MEIRNYFYKHEGKTLKYVYCIRGCNEPYKQEQIGSDIEKISNIGYICRKCLNELNLSDDSTIKTNNEEVTRITELENESYKEDSIKEVELPKHKQEEIELPKQEENEQLKENKDKFFAYKVLCSDGTYYCGTTSNIDTAIKNHNWGSGSVYTKTRRPVKLIVCKKAESLEDAKKIRHELQNETNVGSN